MDKMQWVVTLWGVLLLEKKDRMPDQFMYLPELRKVRRVTKRSVAGSMFGTDFSYEDFERFQARMDKLSTHINQAKDDVDKVHVSATKISKRFEKIESVELEQNQPPAIEQDKEAGD